MSSCFENHFLYHYYEAKIGAFISLSDLPLDEAEKILDHIRAEGVVFASRRSKEYMSIRRQLEEKARKMFIEKGGRPRRLVPHYMTLGECLWLKEWYKECREIRIPLMNFDPKIISFTYGDLFPTMRYQDGKPYRNNIYRLDEILDLVSVYGYPQEWNKDGKLGPERYIEAQVWDDEPIAKYIGLKEIDIPGNSQYQVPNDV